MAIVFQEQKKPVNWVKILFAAFSVGFLIFAVYYLFFAPAPKIDVVLPDPLKRANQISNLEFADPSAVINDPAFQKLQTLFGAPGVGALGRQNPFAPF